MWQKKGEEGLEEYYKGEKYVDIIGLQVLG